MQFSENSIIFVPDGIEPEIALARTTHMAIAAHPDDAEIMAFDVISQCFDNPHEFFTAVILADGAGSPRQGEYAAMSAQELVRIRNEEQKEAARLGDYGALVMLGYSSRDVKNPDETCVEKSLTDVLKWAKPDYLYTHNPFDTHDTHVAVLLKTLDALRKMSADYRPEKLYGCEVWRSLDWLVPEDRVALDVSSRPELALKLLSVFESQLNIGKRYDLAVLGRRQANATFDNHGRSDDTEAINYAIDLTPLIENPGWDLEVFIKKYLNRFEDDVLDRIKRLGGL
jgi:LmbE family N-acetylglucosaminyl deacetylase